MCPEAIEATMFATLMSVMNVSWDLSSLFGATLMNYYGITQEDDSNLWRCVLWRSFFILLPCFFIGLLPDKYDQLPTGDNEGNRGDFVELSQSQSQLSLVDPRVSPVREFLVNVAGSQSSTLSSLNDPIGRSNSSMSSRIRRDQNDDDSD
jgi:hypothetical protein